VSVAVEKTSVSMKGRPYGQVSVGTDAIRLSDAFIVLHKGVTVCPVDGDIFAGFDANVTSANGFQISSGVAQHFPCDTPQDIFLISEGSVAVSWFGA